MTTAEIIDVLFKGAAFLVLLYNTFKIKDVIKQTNGMKTELVKEVRAAALKKGEEIGKAEALAETKPPG